MHRTQLTNRPWPRNAQQYQRNLCIVFRRRQCGSIFIRLAVVASEKYEVAQTSEKIRTYTTSTSSKVDDFGTKESAYATSF